MRSIYADGLFEGRTALVTGGGSGIGLAIALALGRLGCRIAIAGRDVDRLAAGREALEGEGIAVFVQPTDIREPDQVTALVDGVLAAHGAIDFLVNNAGGQFPASAAAMSYSGWKAVVENNLNGTFLMTHTVATRAMLPAGHGRVVNIVANMWRGFPGMAHTGAARAGVVNLTQSLAVEWAQAGLLVNAVAPGTIRSSGTERYPAALMRKAIAATPLKRMGTVDDVANAVLYLLSPAGDWITGETICVDGGARLWGDIWEIPDPEESP